MHEILFVLEDGNSTELSYNFIKEILQNFHHILNSGIDSIKIAMTNEMWEFIQNQNNGALPKGIPLDFAYYRGK